MSCKTSVIHGKIIADWIKSLWEFKKACRPEKPPLSGLGEREALIKWLVFQMWFGIVASVVTFVMFFLAEEWQDNDPGGSQYYVLLLCGILKAFFASWFTWFSFCEQEPNCCLCACFIIQDWKPMYLLQGLLWVAIAANSSCVWLGEFFYRFDLGADGIYLMCKMIHLVFTILHNIIWLFVGLSLAKQGARTAVVELHETVGKAGALPPAFPE